MPTDVKKKRHCPEIPLPDDRHAGRAAAPCPPVRVHTRVLITLCLLLLGPAMAMAETGDRVYVKFPVVNLRSGPDITSPVTLKLGKGQPLIEVERQDDWVLVATGRSDVRSGWVYANLISPDRDGDKPATPAAADKPAAMANVEKKAPAAKPDPDGPLFGLFRQAFSEFNAKLNTETGKDCFSKVENPGHGVVRLTITDDWPDLTHGQRQQALADIFAIWDAAVGINVPITVDIIDQDGIRLMSKFR
jgi:hypothetical protein